MASDRSTDRRDLHGPFDLVGDVHGCLGELAELLARLGYDRSQSVWHHPDGRTAVFLGDLVGQGPDNVETVRLVMSLCAHGAALCVPGNRDLQWIAVGEGEATGFESFVEGLAPHLWLDEGHLVAAHAGLAERYHGRTSREARNCAVKGEPGGGSDARGLAVRDRWARDYRGRTLVVFGHTPVPEPVWLNNTVNIDTGCAYGGKLTALRYPELEFVSVPARSQYAVSPRRP